MLTMAVRAARAAGTVISRATDHVADLTIESKQRNDFVSEVDRQAEHAIIDILKRAYPDHQFLGEESGDSGQTESAYRWIIDPLDGTTNFLHGLPHYSVSIALEYQGRIELGVIYNPSNQELYTAERGGGAFLNNRRIRVAGLRNLEGALLGTGFPFRPEQDLDAYLKTFRALHGPLAGIRRAGSAALDLAYVAAGRLDGYWEFGLQPWDIAAGVLMVRESGGVVVDFSGKEEFMTSGNLIAANPKITHAMLKAISQSLL
ncbi:inositol monophosphatase [Halothiobacillus neapolitanus c2]|jgi:myo-inositol-1(or 4)-monophosphatase|uniref:Inositol-1-monophosphatase n=2 Tax=Halothiobacillus neapolitanus TaxID=927 RepID=D0KW99_HALNC|nr:inositol monophosphatase [Halothiobacillus neapolitanus c2]TDN59780.1 myo-inositol-1(or 4)-monophosphatase [Halothiobacillus neapolitanus]